MNKSINKIKIVHYTSGLAYYNFDQYPEKAFAIFLKH